MSVVAPIRRNRLYQGIVKEIQQLIERGELKPGDQLPPERTLAEQFQVSRASVREALRALELLDVVETRPGGGTFVRRPSPDDLLRPVTAVLRRVHSRQDVLELRRLLEPEVAALAAQRVTEGEVARLRDILATRERPGTADTGAPRDVAFADAVAQAARNQLLLTLLRAVRDVLDGEPVEPHATLERDRRVLSGLAAHDPSAARAAYE